MKTVELFALSCELSAVLCRAPAEQCQVLRRFGLELGTGYQLYDDCVDIFGSESAAGKSLGTDLRKGKLTLPVLLAWERADASDRALLEDSVGDGKPGFGRVDELLGKYDVLATSLETVQEHLSKARQVSTLLPDSAGRDGLFGLCDYLSRQTDALSSCA